MSSLTIVSSADDPEMENPNHLAVKCACGWRSVWLGTNSEMAAEEHADYMVATLLETEHASH